MVVKWLGVISIHESKVAYFDPKISLPVSSTWKGQNRQNVTILVYCTLEDLRESLLDGSRGVSVTWVNVG
jgi:hypothetical protein